MSIQKPDNPPAFPIAGSVIKDKMLLSEKEYEKIVGKQEGMSLRDWLAGRALTGILSNANLLKVIAEQTDQRVKGGPDLIAEYAYKYADVMLFERMKNA